MGRRFNELIHAVASKAGIRTLPSLTNGTWVRFPTESWPGARCSYEPAVAEAIGEHLTADSVFFDIGAHEGIWTLFARQKLGKTGQIVACEPSPNYELLLQAARIFPNIRPLRVGIGSRAGTARFFGQGRGSSGSFVKEVTQLNESYQPDVPIVPLEVPLETVDTLTEKVGLRPNLIKVDVEGWEADVIQGAKETLKLSAPTWIIEVHPVQLGLCARSEDELIRYLVRAGYEHHEISRLDNGIYTILACHAAKDE